MTEWWRTFFDAAYVRIWDQAQVSGDVEQQVEGLWSLLGLQAGCSVLDAPCGYGRFSLALAKRGARVLGVDLSSDTIAEAERRRDDLGSDQLRYRLHDLRKPLAETGFDVALNLFTCLGYGNEADDAAVLSTLRAAVRPRGIVFIETMHRDRFVADVATGRSLSMRLPDGTLVIEEPRLDPITGRVEAKWYWSGPGGSGEKEASLRTYTATELVRLVEAAGLTVRSTHRGCFPEPFVSPDSPIGARLGILAVRDE